MTEPEPKAVLELLADQVQWPDAEAERATRELLRRYVPAGAGLGRLQDLVVWLAGAQGVSPPVEPARIRAVLFAGEHGIHPAGGSPTPGDAKDRARAVAGTGQRRRIPGARRLLGQTVDLAPANPVDQTVAHVRAAVRGDGIADVLAQLAGVSVRVANLSLSEHTAPDSTPAFAPSGRIDQGDALSREESERAISAGATIADEEIDAGADLLIAADVGLGNTIAAAVIIAVLTSTEPVKLVANDGSLPDAVWIAQVAAIRDARTRAIHHRHDPLALIAISGGADVAALVGFLLQAAARRTPVLLDGVVVAAAALLARDVAPRAVRWWQAAHQAAGPAHALALERLYLEPLLRLGIEVGEGAGTLLAVPMLLGAVRVINALTPSIPPAPVEPPVEPPDIAPPDIAPPDIAPLDIDELPGPAQR